MGVNGVSGPGSRGLERGGGVEYTRPALVFITKEASMQYGWVLEFLGVRLVCKKGFGGARGFPADLRLRFWSQCSLALSVYTEKDHYTQYFQQIFLQITETCKACEVLGLGCGQPPY